MVMIEDDESDDEQIFEKADVHDLQNKELEDRI